MGAAARDGADELGFGARVAAPELAHGGGVEGVRRGVPEDGGLWGDVLDVAEDARAEADARPGG